MLEYLRVVKKEEERVNRYDLWCIVLCYGNFEIMEFYSFEL